jgi:hypothetical protein
MSEEGGSARPMFTCKRDLFASEILCDKCENADSCDTDCNPCSAYEALENDMLGGEP